MSSTSLPSPTPAFVGTPPASASVGTPAPRHASGVDAALVLLRVVIGGIFLAHGAQKLFVYGFAGVTGAFAGMHIPAPGVVGPLAAVLEFLGGLALISGLLVRVVSGALAAEMLGAIVFVHLAVGFFGPNSVEYPLALLGATLALAVAGPGRYSLDAVARGYRARSASPAAARNPGYART